MNPFAKLFRQMPLPREVKSPPAPPPPVPFPHGMTLEKWLASPHLAEKARALFDEELMRMIFGVLQNSIPRGYPGRGIAVNDTMAHIELGRYQGYMDCLDLLNSLAVVPKPSTEVPLDWNAVQEP